MPIAITAGVSAAVANRNRGGGGPRYSNSYGHSNSYYYRPTPNPRRNVTDTGRSQKPKKKVDSDRYHPFKSNPGPMETIRSPPLRVNSVRQNGRYQTIGKRLRIQMNFEDDISIAESSSGRDGSDQSTDFNCNNELEMMETELPLWPSTKNPFYWVYLLLSEPLSSKAAQWTSVFILSAIMFSVLLFIIETLEQFREEPLEDGERRKNEKRLNFFEITDVVCMTIFSLEYLARLIGASGTPLHVMRGTQATGLEALYAEDSLDRTQSSQLSRTQNSSNPNLNDDDHPMTGSNIDEGGIPTHGTGDGDGDAGAGTGGEIGEEAGNSTQMALSHWNYAAMAAGAGGEIGYESLPDQSHSSVVDQLLIAKVERNRKKKRKHKEGVGSSATSNDGAATTSSTMSTPGKVKSRMSALRESLASPRAALMSPLSKNKDREGVGTGSSGGGESTTNAHELTVGVDADPFADVIHETDVDYDSDGGGSIGRMDSGHSSLSRGNSSQRRKQNSFILDGKAKGGRIGNHIRNISVTFVQKMNENNQGISHAESARCVNFRYCCTQWCLCCGCMYYGCGSTCCRMCLITWIHTCCINFSCLERRYWKRCLQDSQRRNRQFWRYIGLPLTRMWVFTKAPLNLIDCIVLLPFLIRVTLFAVGESENGMKETNNEAGASVIVLRTFRLARVFRVLKLSKHTKAVNLFFQVLRRSSGPMSLLMFFLGICVIVFGSIIYNTEVGNWSVEQDCYLRKNTFTDEQECSPFKDMFVSFYWVLVTITTVGYGEMVPQSTPGRILAVVLMLVGVVGFAMPITVISTTFQEEYDVLKTGNDNKDFGLTRIDKWTTQRVCDWLGSICEGSLVKYVSEFKKQDIDGKCLDLNYLTDDVLKELGVLRIVDRERFKKAVKALHASGNVESDPIAKLLGDVASLYKRLGDVVKLIRKTHKYTAKIDALQNEREAEERMKEEDRQQHRDSVLVLQEQPVKTGGLGLIEEEKTDAMTKIMRERSKRARARRKGKKASSFINAVPNPLIDKDGKFYFPTDYRGVKKKSDSDALWYSSRKGKRPFGKMAWLDPSLKELSNVPSVWQLSQWKQ